MGGRKHSLVLPGEVIGRFHLMGFTIDSSNPFWIQCDDRICQRGEGSEDGEDVRHC